MAVLDRPRLLGCRLRRRRAYAVVTYGDGEQLDALGPLPAAQIVAIFRDTPSGSAPTPVPIQLHHIPERRSTDEYDDQYDEREQGDRPPGV